MFALLPNAEEIIRVDLRMPASVRGVEAYLSSPPLLSPSKPGEELFLYLAVSPAAVSAALVRKEEKVQKPVYYASRGLRGAEERY